MIFHFPVPFYHIMFLSHFLFFSFPLIKSIHIAISTSKAHMTFLNFLVFSVCACCYKASLCTTGIFLKTVSLSLSGQLSEMQTWQAHKRFWLQQPISTRMLAYICYICNQNLLKWKLVFASAPNLSCQSKLRFP